MKFHFELMLHWIDNSTQNYNFELNWNFTSIQIIILSWIDNPMQQTQVGFKFWFKWSVGSVYMRHIFQVDLPPIGSKSLCDNWVL